MKNQEWEKRLIGEIPRLRRYARALTRDPQHADDLVQDCLERAWSRKHRWNDNGSLRAWLLTIMHNIFINSLRKRKHVYVSADAIDDTNNVCDEAKLTLRDFEVSIGKLNPEQREIILLASLEDLSYKEISSIVGIPIGTVMSRLSRAREQLRRYMQPNDTMNKVVQFK